MSRRDPGSLAPPLEIHIDALRVQAGADAAVVARAVEARVRAELAGRGPEVRAVGGGSAVGTPGSGSMALPVADQVSRAVAEALARAGYPPSTSSRKVAPDPAAGSHHPPTGSRP